MTEEIAVLEGILQVSFKNKELLQQACTHRSFSSSNNERLEFLGDAILGAVIAHQLYLKHPEATEGELTHMRSRLVRKETLCAIAKENNFSGFLTYGTGDCELSGLLADSVEAIIAAVYLDQGISEAESLIGRLFESRLATVTIEAIEKDAKTQLQEWAQARKYPLPVYTVTSSGPPHERTFRARCSVNGFPIVDGPEKSTRRSAEKAAAQLMVDQINVNR